MCRPCCEYDLIQCRCPSKGTKVGYTVPCCRNAVNQCDPCIIHPGCSLFENCKTCHNGTWKANDDFFVNGKYCTECREGWSGGDCKTCGGVLQRAQGHIALESYPTNARCEWTLQVERGGSIQLRFSLLSLESDHNCRYDYVEVRDGDDLNSPVIGRFCGDRTPPPIKSSGNLLHILFASDGYSNFDGFVLTFQKIAACVSEPPVSSTFYSGRQQAEDLPLRCGPPPKLLHGYHRAAGGAETIEFFCKNSYMLSGNRRSTCLPNGSWSSRSPKCVKVCREPKVSDLVRQTVRLHLSSRYNIHDLLSAGFIPLTSGRQSSGDDVALEEIPRGFHSIYTSIEYRCASPLYQTTGASRRTCLKTGRWSGRHVTCSPVCGKLASFSRLNLSDTQWPWHAAVYIRSPPDHSASTLGSPGGAMLDQQGASEESSFWVLACSGALVAQRRVLVAAQCVNPLAFRCALKAYTGSDRILTFFIFVTSQVSDISVHPDFPSSPDSDVAVLKLKDKVRISERVLPACLPRTQGGEATAQEAYTVRWILTDGHDDARRVELSDAAQCETGFAQGGSRTAAISDKTLCVVSKPSTSPGPCPAVIPGGSGETWQLLALESLVHEKTSCDRQSHTVQTRIANFGDWIEENLK
uniref:Peptidase domain containing associated with muscle regeneration 1a n=1 Tax=Amphiprion percula TaxID=161767 RepID=A0A3P8RI48_AMPPE